MTTPRKVPEPFPGVIPELRNAAEIVPNGITADGNRVGNAKRIIPAPRNDARKEPV